MIKILFFLPFIIGCLFYGFLLLISSFNSINAFVWIALAMLYISGMLMNKNKWWGCILGILIGVLLIYMGTKETGQIVKETPFGVVLCIYYAICAIIPYRKCDKKYFE